MMPLIITAALILALIIAVLCYMAGRARGHIRGWKEHAEWQRIIAEHGLKQGQTVPMECVCRAQKEERRTA